MIYKKKDIKKDTLTEAASSSGTAILIFSVFLIVFSLIVFSFFARREFEKRMVVQLISNAETVGHSIGTIIKKTYDYGISIDSIRGYDDFFKSYLERNKELKNIALFSPDNRLIEYQDFNGHEHGNINLKLKNHSSEKYFSKTDIQSGGNLIAILKIGIAKKFIEDKLHAITYDILTVLAITLLITFELILFLIAVTVTAPINSIHVILQNVINSDFRKTLKIYSNDEIGIFAQSINKFLFNVNKTYIKLKNIIVSLPEGNKVKEELNLLEKECKLTDPSKCVKYFKTLLLYFRPTLFLVVFAESLSISFFPVYVRTLYTPISGLSQELMTSLPISLFMLFWAFSIPIGGIWSDKSGRRQPMVFGACLSSVGFGLTAFANNLILLLIFRSITAIGYGMVYISAQGFIADNSNSKNRTAGMSAFVACFFSGSLSGAAIGGILVDRIGYSYTFATASLIAFLGAFFALKYISSNKENNASTNKFKLNNFKYLFTNKYFIAMLFLTSIPAKICLTGYMYYIAPIFLNSLEITNSSIGRFMISYGLSMVLLSPWSGKMADKTGNRQYYVLAGGLLGGFSLLIPLVVPNTFGVLLSILGLGIAHATGLSSQLAIVLGLFSSKSDVIGSGSVIAIYRLIERIGNISGPIIAGILLSTYSYNKASAIIGILVAVGAILFIILFTIFNILENKK